MILRAAKVSDAPAICGIWNEVIRDTSITFTTDEKKVAQIELLISDRGPAFLVAELDAVLIGFATYGSFRTGPGYSDVVEHSVYLDPSAQGAEVGRDLMDALMDVARDQGKRIMVACLTGDNDRARKFHASLGFEDVGFMPGVGRKFGKLHDLRWMQKNL